MGSFVGTYLLIALVIQISIAYYGGRLVQDHSVKVNYTRKLNHFAHFFLPILLPFILYEPSGKELLLTTFLSLAFFLLFVKPIRDRVKIIRVMFMSFDRPEDRPYTLLWTTSQIVVAMVMLIPIRYYEYLTGLYGLALLPVLVNGIGDGLAEPVGVKFGKHRYKTKALFVKRSYERSIEGSLCVLLSTFFALFILRDLLSHQEMFAAIILLPIVMTITEAKSPHTWDAPFLYLVGGSLMILIKELF